MPQYGIATTSMGDLTSSARRNAASGASVGNNAGQFSDFPDWIPKSPNLGGLDYLQANLRSYFNPKPMLRQTNRAANFMLDSSRSAASAAANAFAQRGMQSGGSSQGAGFAAASAMLPAFNQANMMRMDAQKMAAQMRSDAARTAAGIGSSIGGLYGQHLGNMSDYATRQQALQMQGRGLAFQQDQWEDQKRLRDQLQSLNSQGGVKATPFQGQITRAPNNGGGGRGVEYTPEYLDYLNSAGISAGYGPAGYPMGGGIAGGMGLDAYNASQRAMFAQADPRTPAYNYGMTPDVYNLNDFMDMDGRRAGTPKKLTLADLLA